MKPGFMDVTLKRQDSHHKGYENFSPDTPSLLKR